jgi:hypothetical protein
MQDQIEETQIEVPLTEEDKATEVEIPEDKKSEPDVVEVTEAEEEQPEEPQKASPEEQTQEHEEYSAKVKKRIDKMTAKLREAERREQAAVEYAQNVQKHLEDERRKATALDNNYLTESEGRIDSQLAIVEANLKNAVTNGDGDAAVEAQKVLAQLVYQKEKLENDKKQRKLQQEQRVEQPVTQQQPQQQRIDPKARKWAEDNEWFGEDRVMTSGAMEIHNQLSAEGFDLTSDEYYDELNRRIRKEFPHKFKKQADTSNVPSVAPATRTNKTGRTRSIKLTQSEVSIARRLGVPLEEYAKYVRRS